MENNEGKKAKGRFTRKQWIKFSIAAVLYTLFAIWMENLWLLLGLIIIVDVFLTHYIPWGAWKRSKNPAIRNALEWVDDILFALVAVYLINLFIFQNYQIPSHQLVHLPELPDSQLFVGKIVVGGRLPVRQQAELRTARAQHAALVPAGTEHAPHPQLQILPGMAGMGL